MNGFAHTSSAERDFAFGERVAIQSSSSRTITVGGREFLFFGGCGYLALAHEPSVLAALNAAAARHGVSSGASRETTGNVEDHGTLEREIAEALELDDALLLPEGACANLALGESLGHAALLALVDHGAHPSVLQAARLGSAQCETYADLAVLRERIKAANGEVAIWTDGVFPSSGRRAELSDLLESLPPARGLLIVDDCHGLGVLGPRGRGSLEAAGVHDPRVIVTGTLSKALGTYGGFVAGAREHIAGVRQRSALYASTTPIPPSLAAAARVALKILVENRAAHSAYRRSLRLVRERLGAIGVPLEPLEFPVAAFELEPPERMQRVHQFGLREGIFLPLIHYAGGGPHGFFRIVWNAAHTPQDLDRLLRVLGRALESA